MLCFLCALVWQAACEMYIQLIATLYSALKIHYFSMWCAFCTFSLLKRVGGVGLRETLSAMKCWGPFTILILCRGWKTVCWDRNELKGVGQNRRYSIVRIPDYCFFIYLGIFEEKCVSLTNFLGFFCTFYNIKTGKFEPRQNQQNECAPSQDSDQPGHPPSLIRVFAVHSVGS